MHYLVIGHCEFKEPDYIFYQGNYNAAEIEKMAEKDLTEEYITEYDEDDLDEDGNFPLDEDGRFDPSRLDNLDKFSNGIKSFMFSLDLQSPERMDEFIKSANEMSLKLFKREDEFVEEYIKTPAMSSKEKIKDIEIMIEYFIENGERYEDCAILHKIKERIINYEVNNLYKQLN